MFDPKLKLTQVILYEYEIRLINAKNEQEEKKIKDEFKKKFGYDLGD